MVREVTKKPVTTLTELQSVLADMGECARRTTVSAALHKSMFYGRVARWKPLLRKRHMKNSESMRQKILWSDETKIELWLECKALRLSETDHSSSTI